MPSWRLLTEAAWHVTLPGRGRMTSTQTTTSSGSSTIWGRQYLLSQYNVTRSNTIIFFSKLNASMYILIHIFVCISDFLQYPVIYCVLWTMENCDICMDNKNICGASGDWCWCGPRAPDPSRSSACYQSISLSRPIRITQLSSVSSNIVKQSQNKVIKRESVLF